MSSKKILICDDDEGILDVLGLILEDSGHTIISEINSLNVKTVLETQHPDLVILDLWMPVLSGDQILKMIRNHPQYHDLPVVIISASRDGEQIATALKADAFIAKPFDYDELLEVVEGLIG
ncbi:MAG TPA: response regulator [Pelobium sp.]